MSDGSDPAGETPQGFVPWPPPVVEWGWTQRAVEREPLVAPVPAALAQRLITVALAIGLAFQVLFVGQGIGINALLLTVVLLSAAALTRPRAAPFDRADAWLPPLALLFATALVVRADGALMAFDGLATVGLTAASLAALAGIHVTRRSVGGLMALGVRGGVVATAGAVELRGGLRAYAGQARAMPGSPLRRIAVGLLLGLPVAAVFAALFAQADAVFGTALDNLLDWRLEVGDVPVRLGVTAAAAWVVAGMLVLVAGAGKRIHRDEPFVPPARLGAVEATVALLAIDALFAVFVVLQGAYLFGGRDTLAAAGMTYSDYARRGFFELVAATAIVGILIVAVESVIAERPRVYRAAALALVGLTGLILVSAAVRLNLYQQAYGWTELRFYVFTAMGWLGLCLAAAAVTVVRSRSRRLPHAVVALAFGVALVANLVGPESFIASRNVERALHPEQVAAGGSAELDAEYLRGLGDGAVPVLIDALPRLGTGDRRALAAALGNRRRELNEMAATQGWPSWNLARDDARNLLNATPLP